MNAPLPPAGLDALRFGSGHTVRRIEDPTLVAGQGRYTIALSHYEAVPPHVQTQLMSSYKVKDED